MQAKSIDQLLEEMIVFGFRHRLPFSTTTQKTYSQACFDLDQVYDVKDYDIFMDIAFKTHESFLNYLFEMQSGDLSSIEFPGRVGEERKLRIIRETAQEFLKISAKFYDLFAWAAQEFIEARLGSNAKRVNSHNQIEDDGVYLVILPQSQRNGRFNLVESTYVTGEIEHRESNGKARLSLPVRVGTDVHSFTITEQGTIIRGQPHDPIKIHLRYIDQGLVYKLDSGLNVERMLTKPSPPPISPSPP